MRQRSKELGTAPWLGGPPPAMAGSATIRAPKVAEVVAPRPSAGALPPEVRRLLHAIAVRMLDDHHAASDVVQEALLRSRAVLPQLPTEQRVRAYLVAVVRNLCRDELRRRRRLCVGLPDRFDRAEEPRQAAVDDRLLLVEVLDGLSAADRDVLHHRVGLGLPHRDVAGLLGINEATARTRLHRALDRARARAGHLVPSGTTAPSST